jgi:hypothetical protein
MAFAAASKAFRASTACADVVLTPGVMSATKRTARNHMFRVIYLSSWGVENQFKCKPHPLARLYGATEFFSKRIYCCTASESMGQLFAAGGSTQLFLIVQRMCKIAGLQKSQAVKGKL